MKTILTMFFATTFAAVSFGVSAAPLTSETAATRAGAFELDVKAKKAGKKKAPKKKAAAGK